METASTSRPDAWTAFRQSIVRFEREKVEPGIAIRNTAGVALPLAIGVALGSPASGVAVAMGAFNVSFSDSSEPYPVRVRRMLAAAALVGFAVFAGEFCGSYPLLSVAVAAGWAFGAGMLVALSSTAADLGTISLVTLIVYSSTGYPLERAVAAGWLAFAGGLLQTALSAAAWPLRRYEAERRALGELFLDLSRGVAAPIDPTGAPPASASAILAHSRLSTVDRDRSTEGERYRILLSQAERMRLSLLTLRRLRARIRRQTPEHPELPRLQRFFELCSQLLAAIGTALPARGTAESAARLMADLEAEAEALRTSDASRPTGAETMLLDARRQVDALGGQFRAAIELVASATPAGLEAFARKESQRPWSLRLRGTVATLAANWSLRSAAFRHALRLAVCVGVAEGIGRGFGLDRSYWLPMTVAIVLKPDFSSTFSRGILRLAGTFVGLLLATGLFHLLPSSALINVFWIAVFCYLLRSWGRANYGLLVAAVSGFIVFLFAMQDAAPGQVIGARAWNTVLGGAISLAAYALWPTWERTVVPESVARLLDGYREYFREVKESYAHPEEPRRESLEAVRAATRLARSNLEASVERALSEPGVSAGAARLLTGMLASSHRLAHALMSLEGGLSSSIPVPARAEFRPFADHVELTLYYLAAALRGSPLTREDLPDLREDHYALVHSGSSLHERHALVNTETDRITNSLNTLSEEILAWIALVVRGR